MNPLLEELAARVGSMGISILDTRPIRVAGSASPVQIGAWTCVGRLGGTFTPGDDWRVEFDGPGMWYWDCPTFSGAIDLLIRDNPGTQGARMATLSFDAQQPFTLLSDLRVTAGRVQVHVNGERSEFSASSQPTLSFSAGRNTVCLIGNAASGDILFRARLFDGRSSQWAPV